VTLHRSSISDFHDEAHAELTLCKKR